jgi:hypothetical protein
MSTIFECDDKDTLIAFFYDEVDADTRRQVAAHLQKCLACAGEIAALYAVRRDLSGWQPPDADLDFAIVSKASTTVLRPARWLPAALPAWAQVAAAMLVFAAGAAIANVHVRYDREGLVVSTGWMAPPAAPAAVVAPAPADEWRPALTALESDLRRELQSMRASTTANAARTAGAASVDGEAVVRRVQALINQSEQRQRQDLAIRMTQFDRDVEMRRRTDLARINGVVGQLNGRTGAVEGYQRDMVNLLRRVSSTQQVP